MCSIFRVIFLLFSLTDTKLNPYTDQNRNCSVPSQIRAKIHSKSAMAIGFLPSSLSFPTVSAVNAQTY